MSTDERKYGMRNDRTRMEKHLVCMLVKNTNMGEGGDVALRYPLYSSPHPHPTLLRGAASIACRCQYVIYLSLNKLDI